MKRSLLTCLSIVFFQLQFSDAAVITLTGLSNTDWVSPSDSPLDPARRNNTVVTQDSVVVGDRAGAPAVGDGSNTATLDVSDFIEDGEGSPSGATLAYTVGGLDLDGSGGFNDSFVLNFTVTASEGINTPGFAGTDVPDDEPLNQGYLRLLSGNINDPGEFINIQFSSLLVNLSGGSGNGSGTFDGFSQVELLNTNASTNAQINGVTQALGTSVVDLTPGGLDSGLLMEDGGGGRFYFGNMDAQVTIVPEPSSLLVALLGFGLLLRRRRCA